MRSTRKALARSVSSAAILIVVGCAGPLFAQQFTEQAKGLQAKHRAQFEELAAWCDGKGLAEQAQKTRHWLGHRDPNKLYIAELPREVGWPSLPPGSSADAVEWDKRFQQIRQQYADELYKLARRAVQADRVALAFDLVLAAARENPDHEGLRRILGFQKHEDTWRTPYEIENLRRGRVWHEKFGWLPEAHVAKYDEGMRFVRRSPRDRGSWVTAAEDARLHERIENGWLVETEHYLIRTNHSLEAAVAMGEKLERLYRVWKELFVRFFATDKQVRMLFDNSAWKLPPRRHKVVYLRTRDEYNRALKAAIPSIEVSIGLYMDSTKTAYFFAGEDCDERTQYHEATHQLFHESRPVAGDVAARCNFWIVEGIAMYMESLRRENGFYVLGGFDDLRLFAARVRLLRDDFYVPLSEFSAMGMNALQADKRIATLYTQAAGLTHFLIHYEGGRYRDALVAYLNAVYNGRDNVLTLPQLTGVGFHDLDAQYRQFIESAPAEPPAKQE